MFGRRFGPRLGGLLLALGACTQVPPDQVADDTSGGTGADTDTLPEPAADGSVPLVDANNYTYEGLLDAPSFTLASLQDVTLSWSGLHTDMRCHTLDPVADIDNTSLLLFRYLTEEEIEIGLSDDSLDQADLAVYLSYAPGDATEASLSQMTFFGTDGEIEGQFTEGSGTWLMLMTTGTQVAVGTRMLAFLHPSDSVADTRAELTDGCPVLDFSSDLTSLRHVPVLRDGPWVFDWSALTRDGHGGDFVTTKIDGVMLARFDESVDELQANFLDLEEMAEETYRYDFTSGTVGDLSTLTPLGAPFPGFTDEGVWVYALTCATCPNPAPLFLTILEPG